MEETKYGHLFFYGYQESKNKNTWSRSASAKGETHLLRLNAEMLKGLPFFAQCNWFWPSLVKEDLETRSTKTHKHTYDEVIGMIGTNPDDPHDLGGEIEMFIDGERHRVTKTCYLYLPAGLEHGPFREIRIDRPIFEFEFGLNGIHD
jgi:hypothetical protein